MNPWQEDVERFHWFVCDIPPSHTRTVDFHRPELRTALIKEEAKELRRAIEARDMVATVDGLVDLLVVTISTAAEFGIDLDPFWSEVHRTNMAKLGGEVRADGKRLKPEGWEPPDLKSILTNHDRQKIAA